MRSMTIFNFLLEAMLIGSALILLMFAIRALGRGRISNRVIYTLWLVVALRLLLPISLPNPLMNELRPTLSVDGEARPVADQIRTRFLDTVDALSGGDGAGAAALSHLGDETRSGRAGKWLVVAYGAAGCLVGVVLAIRSGNRRSRILRNRLATPDENLMAQYHQLCQRYGVKPVPVYLVQKLPAPCVVGVFRPFIAIPQSSADTHIPHMLAHEICHIKAADHLWSLVRSACCILHWINPLVWLAAYLSREDAELACDTRVIGKIEKLDRLSYAAALASAAGRSCTGGNKLMLGGKWLKRRINGVIHSERARNWGIALCSLCCALVLIAAFATRESHKPVFVRNIPQLNWVAAHEPLNDPQAALACARRFLETPFIGVDTSAVALTCEEDPQGWRITAQSSDPKHSPIFSLLLSLEGEVLLYDGSAVLGELSALSWLHTLSAPSDSLDRYAASFAEACLPGRSIAGATPVDDLSAGGGVHLVLTTLTDRDGVLLSDGLALMIEPEIKVVMYEQSAMNSGV
ncbi:MAG: hypothetical protein E7319_08395 [Clostridiales bacterium]|nr:hypothetical protein [Clostridiales bacterium]